MFKSSNNTNKLSPQEPVILSAGMNAVQIIQINLVLKNLQQNQRCQSWVQIIQINLVLKNSKESTEPNHKFK